LLLEKTRERGWVEASLCKGGDDSKRVLRAWWTKGRATSTFARIQPIFVVKFKKKHFSYQFLALWPFLAPSFTFLLKNSTKTKPVPPTGISAKLAKPIYVVNCHKQLGLFPIYITLYKMF
jgi:hypothetical protein